MAINTHTTNRTFGHYHEQLAKDHGRPAGGRPQRKLLTILTGALVGVTIGLAALGAYAVLDDDSGAASPSPGPSAPAPADPADVPGAVTDVSLFAEVGIASADPRAVVQSILTNGGYAEGWTSSALYDSENLIVVALTYPDNPPGSEYQNMFRLVQGDDGLWHAFPGYDVVNGVYGTAEDAMFGYAIKNHPGAAINASPGELPDGTTAVSWTVTSDSPDSRTYEIAATGAEPLTVVITKVTEIDAETGAEIEGWRGTPAELFPF